MRASVSDITLFRKCPRAWQYSRKYDRPNTSPALDFGTKLHLEVETVLQQCVQPVSAISSNSTPLLTAMKPSGITQIVDQLKDLKLDVLEVERAFEFDFRGHTLVGRPDGVLQHKIKDDIILLQVKTVARKVDSHKEYLVVHPHELVYAEAVSHFCHKPVNTTLLIRYVKVKEPYLLFDVLYHDPDVRRAAMDSLEATLNEMERYAEKDAPQHTDQCVNWFTGAVCPYKGPCLGHQGWEGYPPATDRYPEFTAGYQNAGGSGPGNYSYKKADFDLNKGNPLPDGPESDLI